MAINNKIYRIILHRMKVELFENVIVKKEITLFHTFLFC